MQGGQRPRSRRAFNSGVCVVVVLGSLKDLACGAQGCTWCGWLLRCSSRAAAGHAQDPGAGRSADIAGRPLGPSARTLSSPHAASVLCCGSRKPSLRTPHLCDLTPLTPPLGRPRPNTCTDGGLCWGAGARSLPAQPRLAQAQGADAPTPLSPLAARRRWGALSGNAPAAPRASHAAAPLGRHDSAHIARSPAAGCRRRPGDTGDGGTAPGTGALSAGRPQSSQSSRRSLGGAGSSMNRSLKLAMARIMPCTHKTGGGG